MPRAKDPGTIKTGPGKAVLSPTDNLVLLGGGMAGPPNVGQPGYIPPDASFPGGAVLGFPEPTDDSSAAGLISHVNDSVDAHHASAIGLVPESKVLFSNNVQGAVDEFVSGVATPPPMLGQHFQHMSFSSVPDWGSLKLRDQVYERAASADEYPYYHTYPSPTSDWTPALANNGNDPQTDSIWNGGDSRGIVNLPGTGLGLAKAGAFTVSGLAPQPIKRTRALAVQIDGANLPVPVVVSGCIFPSDRGVLALIHWPPEDTVVDFLAQTSLERVVAAIVLGSGASAGGNDCITKLSVPPVTCDGATGAGKASANTGSIFSVGLDANGNYDPFAYPGQAGGQYDLHEINTGISDATGETLPGVGAFPWWGNGWQRVFQDLVTGAGQVRWGTDPTVDPDPAVVTDWGIPILGAGPDAYAAATGGPVTVKDPYVPGVPKVYSDTWGSTIITSSNFFRYRLPYLQDYTAATGLKHTPRGLSATATRETKRYFDTAALNTGTITRAGNYANFAEDHWNWQIARYRHSFYIPFSSVAGAARELGTYWMIHFKTERDFESFVRDGKMPWDPSPDGYEVYGVSLVDTSAIEVYGNRVNETPDLTGDPGTGPAPNYGYGSKAYHALRTSIITADNTTLPTAVTNTFTWAYNDPAVTPNQASVMFVSGIAYFVPLNADGDWGFDLFDIDLAINDPWKHFYRTDDNDLTGVSPPAAPARLSSPCPMFMGIAPFAYETVLTVGTDIEDVVFGSLTPRSQRLEVPFEYMGDSGTGPFTDINGPLNASQIVVTSLGRGVRFPGDVDVPAFTENARPRVFVRRPLAAIPIQPLSTPQGNGIALNPTNLGGAKVLFHSTRWNLNDTTAGHYGNFITGAAPAVVYPDLVNATKDTEERFLDETYRYFSAFGGEVATDALLGPGMNGWVFGPIPTPVRIGANTTTWVPPMGANVAWQTKSFAQNEEYLNGLAAEELQVVGLPTRNPRWPNTVNDGPLAPFPSAGLLAYPQKDYSAGYVPDNTVAGGGLAFAQPSYLGSAGERTLIRTFDAAFVASAPDWEIAAANQPFVVFRVDGLTLDDFRYVPHGSGGLGDGLDGTKYTGIAIMVKVPGLTTWMDLGRLDGDGPSKQDVALDGAGCQVQGPNTFSSIDPTTGMVYCQVKVNVGPMVNLAWGEDELGTGLRMVPVMVKAVMNELAVDYNMEETYTGFPGQFDGVVAPGAWAHEVRGLCGIKVIRSRNVETAPIP